MISSHAKLWDKGSVLERLATKDKDLAIKKLVVVDLICCSARVSLVGYIYILQLR